MAGQVRVHEQTGVMPVRSVALEAVVTRADGTVENLGEIARWDRSRVKRVLSKLKRKR